MQELCCRDYASAILRKACTDGEYSQGVQIRQKSAGVVVLFQAFPTQSWTPLANFVNSPLAGLLKNAGEAVIDAAIATQLFFQQTASLHSRIADSHPSETLARPASNCPAVQTPAPVPRPTADPPITASRSGTPGLASASVDVQKGTRPSPVMGGMWHWPRSQSDSGRRTAPACRQWQDRLCQCKSFRSARVASGNVSAKVAKWVVASVTQ
jgi:hypothetical protein